MGKKRFQDVPMRTDWTDQNDDTLRPSSDDFFVHRNIAVLTPSTVFAARVEHLKPTHLQSFFELHCCKALPCGFNETTSFIQQNLIHQIVLAVIAQIFCFECVCDPCFLVNQRQDGTVGRAAIEIRVVQGISSVCTSKPGGVSAVLFHSLVHHQEVAL